MQNHSCRRLSWTTLLVISLILPAPAAFAQGLVSNGDFESYVNCPWDLYLIWSGSPTNPPSQYITVLDWSSAHLTTRADYLNARGAVPNVQTPENKYGYRTPHSGQAYIGLSTYSGGKSQCIMTQLLRPMVKDSIYEVRFFTSPASCRGFAGGTKGPTVISVREIGAHFTADYPANPPGDTLTLAYHIINDTTKPMTDTAQWYEVRGRYTAKGGENWMVVGRVQSAFSARSKYDTLYAGIGSGSLGYNYIDDVSVMPVAKLGVQPAAQPSTFSEPSISPVPVVHTIHIHAGSGMQQPAVAMVRDVTGRIVRQERLRPGQHEIDVAELAPGTYFLQLSTSAEAVMRSFIKQ